MPDRHIKSDPWILFAEAILQTPEEHKGSLHRVLNADGSWSIACFVDPAARPKPRDVFAHPLNKEK